MDVTIPRLKISHILWICLIGALVIRALYQRWKYRRIYSLMASLPGPVALPFVGASYVFWGITKSNICSKLRTFVRNYPGVAGLWEREEPHVITSSREVINAVLHSRNIDKTYHYEHFKMDTKSTFASSGAEWRFRRNITNPSFRTNVLMLFDDNIYHHSKVFVDQLGQHAGGGEVDIFVPVHLCYIDMTIENMCGIQLGGQENRLTRLSTAMSGVAEIIVERTFSILLWTDFVYSLTGKMKLLNQLVDENQSVPRMIVEQRIKERKTAGGKKQHSGSPKIYLDRLLDSFDAGGLTKDQIVADVLDLFFAGTITAAITTSWVFKYLALYPDTQERAYQEIKETCVDGEVKLNDVSKLTYIEMIIKETLRHVGTPLTSRNLTEDVKVRGNMTIPAGTNVVMCFHELHHDSQYWQRPGEFYPEHFSPANERRRPKGAFNAFLSGPRICPGNKYAMRAMVFLIASTLLRYKFSTDEKPPKDLREMEYRYVFMLYPLSGFRVKIRQR